VSVQLVANKWCVRMLLLLLWRDCRLSRIQLVLKPQAKHPALFQLLPLRELPNGTKMAGHIPVHTAAALDSQA